MADVKTLVRGTSAGGWERGRKGDIWAITPGDYGTAEVAPDWVQLTITDVPGTQEEATKLVHQYRVSIATGFDYSEVTGAGAGEQRYRVEVKQELDTVPNPVFQAVRDGVSAYYATTGSHVNQSVRRWFEFDGVTEIPLEEIEFQAQYAAQDSRRYRMDENYIDNLLGSVGAGEPAAVSESWTWFQTNVVDKLS